MQSSTSIDPVNNIPHKPNCEKMAKSVLFLVHNSKAINKPTDKPPGEDPRQRWQDRAVADLKIT